MISVVCPYCKEEYDFPDDYVGCKVACDNCEGRFFILDAAGRTQADYQKTNKDSDTQKSFEEKYTKCPRCKTAIKSNDNVIFCSYCGTNLACKQERDSIQIFSQKNSDFSKITSIFHTYSNNIFYNKSKIFKISFIILILSTILFFYNVIKAAGAENGIQKLNTEYEILIADYNHKTSMPAFVDSLVKSVFHGATFGIFAEEGIFTESKRWDRNINTAKRESTRIKSELKILKNKQTKAAFWRNLFFVMMLVSSLAMIIDYSKTNKEKK